ncbi:MAG: hypothetical protein J7L30_02730 [Methanophagales archaeon]|nr:hypothetical protein [Methanophagales archaeon]MCW7074449.1 hypothetical protein [Candidatus Methanospirare jalkutatii]UYZ40607.1 MAG: hypothetical protein N2V74_02635 [Candidatus Methanospirare jalkutatii]UYZ40721.1 MAG: hypothetical protein N2V74_03225 [Candidatus Methanospirare jalkutatii]
MRGRLPKKPAKSEKATTAITAENRAEISSKMIKYLKASPSVSSFEASRIWGRGIPC